MSSSIAFVPCVAAPAALRQTSFINRCPTKVSTPPGRVSVPVRQSSNAPRMLFGIQLFPLADVVCLPKDDKDMAGRKKEIEEKREQYTWAFDVIGKSPMIDGVPRDELPKIGWVEGLLNVIFRVVSNKLAVRLKNRKESFLEEKRNLLLKIGLLSSKIFQKIALGSAKKEDIAGAAAEVGELLDSDAEGKGETLDDYRELFQVYKPDTVAKLDQFLRDDIFGWYRVAGPSPLHLRKFTGNLGETFPELTNEILKGIPNFTGDSLEEIVAENRLYCLDYPEFEGLPTGKLPDGTLKEGFHVYGPTALLAVPKVHTNRTTVLPIAIRCGQGISKYPMYTPNPEHSDPVTWIAAKCTVQVADGVMHEARYHLGRTHLLLEVFICAAHRALAPNHPLLRFMTCHFEGTALINFLGSLRLAPPGGTIDNITAPQIETTTAVCVGAMRSPFKFNEWMPDRELANRGVLDEVLKYPYRDDALKLWDAIQEWVGAYVRSYYSSDADVAGDNELADWCKEVVDPNLGAIPGFGDNESGQVKTVDYLIKFISTLVYIGSVQHAALNFPQGTLMQFVPAMPLAGFAPAPTTPKPFNSVEEWVAEMLPPMKVAQRQTNTAELLAGMQWTSLGEYGRDLNFVSNDVDEALKKFKEDLSKIGAEVQLRNQQERSAGLPIYDFLVPKNIPQSANV